MAPEVIPKDVLEIIINSFQEAAIIVDKNGVVLFANETFAKNAGRNLKEVLNKSFYDLFPPEVAQRRKSHLDYVVKTKKTSSFEDERSGRHFIAYMTPMIDDKGDVDKVSIIVYDITEKKRLENELINTKEHLMSILNSIDESIYIADINNYKIIFANKYTKKSLGMILRANSATRYCINIISHVSPAKMKLY